MHRPYQNQTVSFSRAEIVLPMVVQVGSWMEGGKSCRNNYSCSLLMSCCELVMSFCKLLSLVSWPFPHSPLCSVLITILSFCPFRSRISNTAQMLLSLYPVHSFANSSFTKLSSNYPNMSVPPVSLWRDNNCFLCNMITQR